MLILIRIIFPQDRNLNLQCSHLIFKNDSMNQQFSGVLGVSDDFLRVLPCLESSRCSGVGLGCKDSNHQHQKVRDLLDLMGYMTFGYPG